MAEQDLSPEALRALLKTFLDRQGPDLNALYNLDLTPDTLDGMPETAGEGLLRLGQWLIEIKEHRRTAIYSVEFAPGEDTTLLVHVEPTPEAGWAVSDWDVEEGF